MMGEDMNILPEETVKNESIRLIIEQGMPEKRSLFRELLKMYRAIGFKGLFFGVEEDGFIGLLLLFCMAQGMFNILRVRGSMLPVILFISAPLLYGMLHIYASLKELSAGMYELKLTTRYNMEQLSTLRMLVFGAVSMAAVVLENMLLMMLLRYHHVEVAALSTLRMLSIVFCAIFLYAAMELLAELHASRPLQCLVVPAIWFVAGIFLLTAHKTAEKIITAIPTVVFILVALGAFVLYIAALKRYYYIQKEGIAAHAFS